MQIHFSYNFIFTTPYEEDKLVLKYPGFDNLKAYLLIFLLLVLQNCLNQLQNSIRFGKLDEFGIDFFIKD